MTRRGELLLKRSWRAASTVLLCLAASNPSLFSQEIAVSVQVIDNIDTLAGYQTRYINLNCADADHCVVIGERINTGPSGGADHNFVRRTTDGGATWNMVRVDSFLTADDPLRYYGPTRVAHPTPDLIFIGNRQGFLLTSTDGGTTWQVEKPLPDSRFLDGIYMLDGTYGVAMMNGEPIYTADGGAEWSRIEVPDTLRPDTAGLGGIVNIALASPRRIVVSARINGRYGYGGVAVTEDFGATWQIRPLANEGMGRFMFVNSRDGWAGGIELDPAQNEEPHDLILRTRDGGLTWTEQVNRIIEPAFGIANIDFFDTLRGVAAGALGKLLVTDDGGKLSLIHI